MSVRYTDLFYAGDVPGLEGYKHAVAGGGFTNLPDSDPSLNRYNNFSQGARMKLIRGTLSGDGQYNPQYDGYIYSLGNITVVQGEVGGDDQVNQRYVGHWLGYRILLYGEYYTIKRLIKAVTPAGDIVLDAHAEDRADSTVYIGGLTWAEPFLKSGSIAYPSSPALGLSTIWLVGELTLSSGTALYIQFGYSNVCGCNGVVEDGGYFKINFNNPQGNVAFTVDGPATLKNIIVNTSAGSTGFRQTGQSVLTNCVVTSESIGTGFWIDSDGCTFRCSAISSNISGTGFYSNSPRAMFHTCYARRCSTGFSNTAQGSSSFVDCIADSCNTGFSGSGYSWASGCLSYKSGQSFIGCNLIRSAIYRDTGDDQSLPGIIEEGILKTASFEQFITESYTLRRMEEWTQPANQVFADPDSGDFTPRENGTTTGKTGRIVTRTSPQITVTTTNRDIGATQAYRENPTILVEEDY